MKSLKNFFPLLILFFCANSVFAQYPCSSGISLNGSDDFITLDDTDAINLQNTRDRTIEFWFKTSDITTRQVMYEEGANVNAFLIYLEAGRVYLGAYRDNGTAIADRRYFRSGAGEIETNKWHHVALTLEDTTSPDLTLKWFLDGVEQDSQDGLQVNSHSGDISFGRNSSGDNLRFPDSLVSNWNASSIGLSSSETYNSTITTQSSSASNFTGNISMFRIWNVARTQSEIDTNKSTLLTSGTDLVAYSDLDRIYYVPNGATEISLTAFVSLNTQYTTIPNTDAINLQNTRDRTIEFRFKATDMTTRQVLYEEGGNVNAITAFIEDGRFYFGAYRSNAGAAANRKFFRSGSGDVVFNTWYHVAITLEDTTSPDLTLKWYLDGVEQDSQDGMQIDNHSGDINIGRSGGSIRYPDVFTGWNASSVGGSTAEYYDGGQVSNGDANNFSGDFDLFRIWNVARTQSEIDTNKNTLLTSGTDLVAYQSGTQMNYQEDGETSIGGTQDAAGVITWDGSDSSVWSTATNWVGDNAPDATRRQKVAIPNDGTNPILTTEVSVGFLTINTGVDLVIQSGATLNVYYGLDNNGTITVENGGSLIYHNCNSSITGSGTFDVIRNTRDYGTGNNDFYSYWSSPIIEADASISTIFPDAELIYTFAASSDPANWVAASGNMVKGTGYAIQNEGTGGQVRTFSGTINEPGTDLTLYFNENEDEGEVGNVWSTEGDNLIGNPYASAIDWDLIIDDKDNQNIEGTIYLWNQTSAEVGDNNVSDYLQYNPTGGGTNTTTGKIGSAQAFFLRTTVATNIKIKATHQIAANNTTFYRPGENTVTEKKIGRSWFKISRENIYNTLLVGFVEKATNEYDRIYDGPFDINQTSLGFYSLLNDNKKLTIQGLPLLTENEKIVNIGFIVDKDGEHTISIQEEHINDDYFIYLEDLEENVLIDLRNQDYTFTVNTLGENNTRFRVIYTTQERETLSLDENIFDEQNFSVFVNKSKELILRYPRLDLIENVSIYNILGSEMATFSNKEVKNLANLRTGFYIVKATLSNGKKLAKKIVFTK